MESPLKIKEKAYEKQNRKMRSKYKKETGKSLGSRQTTGTGKRRISFACRFAGMAGKLKTAVTGKVKAGSKDAKRRKSFCARSKGWTGERGKAARRRWKC